MPNSAWYMPIDNMVGIMSIAEMNRTISMNAPTIENTVIANIRYPLSKDKTRSLVQSIALNVCSFDDNEIVKQLHSHLSLLQNTLVIFKKKTYIYIINRTSNLS
jgi:hypothetical protein